MPKRKGPKDSPTSSKRKRRRKQVASPTPSATMSQEQSSSRTSNQPSSNEGAGSRTGAVSKTRVICDPIHGHIELSEACAKIVDTPQFQRLRFIKQLGFSYFVYPGASHNRFEHSLGTCHLAKELVNALRNRQRELRINKKDVLCVEIAALCHDLGHGPFSHTFEKFIKKYDKHWKHEKASVAMFDHLIKVNNLKLGLTRKDIRFIKELINPPKKGDFQERPKKKWFLYEIVSNRSNGIDVDKWDYFARDCHMSGIKNSFDHLRCIRYARVIQYCGKHRICFRDKEAADLYEMFYTRSRLHRCLYKHKISCVLDEMVTRSLDLAKDQLSYPAEDGNSLPLHETINDMTAYALVNDDVFTKIQTVTNVNAAKKIIENILNRRLFTMVSERTLGEKKKVCTKKKLLEEYSRTTDKKGDNEQPSGSSEPTEENIIINEVTFDFGKKTENPMNFVLFYAKNKPNKAHKIRKDQVPALHPEKFKYRCVRLFCNIKDENVMERLEKAFESLH